MTWQAIHALGQAHIARGVADNREEPSRPALNDSL